MCSVFIIVFVFNLKMGIIITSNIEEATEGGSNVIPVKTGKRCEFLGR